VVKVMVTVGVKVWVGETVGVKVGTVEEWGVIVGVGVKEFGLTGVGSKARVGVLVGVWVKIKVGVLLRVGVEVAYGKTGVIFFKQPVSAAMTSMIKTAVLCVKDFGFISNTPLVTLSS